MASLGENSGDTFQASDLAKWFHSAPHRDFHFESTTTVFSPSDESYNESLYLLVIFISSFGGLLFITFVVYYSCCSRPFCKKSDRMSSDSYHARKSCLQCFIIILAVICCGAVFMGFISNGRTSDGVDQFCNAVDDVQSNINDASSLGNNAKSRLITAKSNINILMGLSKSSDARAASVQCRKAIDFQDYLNGLLPQDVVNDSHDVSDKVHQYENYRWCTTFGVLMWCALLIVLSFWSGCRTNGCIMAILTILTLFSVLFTWVLLGIDFGIAMGIGDFCVSPAKAIKKIKNKSEISVVIDYYINCESFNPFTPTIGNLSGSLTKAIHYIGMIQDYERLTTEILRDLDFVKNNLSIYEEDFACSRIHEEYMHAMKGLCDKSLNGLALVMLALLIIAFLTGLLTCCVCPLWKYRKSYNLAYPIPDEDDAPIGDRDEPVLWWPHDLGGEERRNRGQANRYERTPLIPNEHPPNEHPPNYETMDNRHSNLNHIQQNGAGDNERRDANDRPQGQDHQHLTRHYSF